MAVLDRQRSSKAGIGVQFLRQSFQKKVMLLEKNLDSGIRIDIYFFHGLQVAPQEIDLFRFRKFGEPGRKAIEEFLIGTWFNPAIKIQFS